MSVPMSPELDAQLKGEKNLNKSAKDIFGRLLGPPGGQGGFLYAKLNGLMGTLSKPLSSVQSSRVKITALEVLTKASETYQEWLQANNKIADTVSTIPLTGPDASGVEISAAETHLTSIVTAQQQISLTISARYDTFTEQINELLQSFDLTNDMVLAGKPLSSARLDTDGGDVPPLQGSINVNLPGLPAKLEWGSSPSDLEKWFLRWDLWWNASYQGPSNPGRLVQMQRMYMSDEWLRVLSDVNWGSISPLALQNLMDAKLNIRFPPLKRTVRLLTDLKLAGSESPSQFLERVGREMRSGGIGIQPHINLTWERLLIILVVKGLPNNFQIELLKRFDTLECTIENLTRFLDTLSQSKSLGGEVHIIKKNSPPHKPVTKSNLEGCKKCKGTDSRHLEEVKKNSGVCIRKPCDVCKRFFHTAATCWKNPASPSFRGSGSINRLGNSAQSSQVAPNITPPLSQEIPTFEYEGTVQTISPNTPRITVNISQGGKQLGTSPLLCDSGSTVNIVSLSFAREKHLELVKVNSANFSLSAANGGFLSVEFTTEVDLELPNSEHVQRVSLLVSPDLQASKLSGRDDQRSN